MKLRHLHIELEQPLLSNGRNPIWLGVDSL